VQTTVRRGVFGLEANRRADTDTVAGTYQGTDGITH
jgi:hypothetical protein